jgi:hypothetical protein
MKYTRKQLLIALGDCQSLFGRIAAAAGDRNPNRAADLETLTRQGFNLCLKIRNTEPPIGGTLLDKED